MKLKSFTKLTTIIALITSPVIFTSCGEKKTDEITKTSSEKSKPKSYPLDDCLVSGEKLGGMGEPHVFIYKGQEIKMCCDNCVPKFDKNPEKFLAKLKPGYTPSPDEMDHRGHGNSH